MEEPLHHNAWDEEYNIHHIDALRGKAVLESVSRNAANDNTDRCSGFIFANMLARDSVSIAKGYYCCRMMNKTKQKCLKQLGHFCFAGLCRLGTKKA